jgi:dienelactone hydrolase
MKKYSLLFAFTLFSLVFSAQRGYCEVKMESVDYEDQGTKLTGYLAYDDSIGEPRPGVLVVHEWWGVNDYAKRRAREIAGLGYVAFALDMYGKDKATQDPQKAREYATAFKSDRKLMRRRAKAGLDVLTAQPLVDKSRIAVAGYCFGGTTALELARSGADLRGAVCFHGSLDTPDPSDAKNIKGKVLVMLGSDDPNISAKEIEDFKTEMRNAHVDWQMNIYGNAVHSFTNPDAGNDNSKGAAYNALADRRSFDELKRFLREIF